MQHEARPDFGEVSSRERALEQYAQDLHRREIQLMRDRIHKRPVGGGPTLGNAPGRKAAGAERVQAARAAQYTEEDDFLLTGGAASTIVEDRAPRQTTFARSAREVTAPLERPDPLDPREVRGSFEDDRATRRSTKGGWSGRASRDMEHPSYIDDPRWRGTQTQRSVVYDDTRPPSVHQRQRPKTSGGDRRRQLKEAHASLNNLMSDYGIDSTLGRSPQVIRRPKTASVAERRKKVPRTEGTLGGQVERLFKGEPSISVPSALAPPQYGATRRRWFQEVPPTEWFRHHHLIDPWVRYHTEGFPTPAPEPEPEPSPKKKKKKKKKAKKKREPSPPPVKTPKKKKKKKIMKKKTPPPSPRPVTPVQVRNSSAQTPPVETRNSSTMKKAPEARAPPADPSVQRRKRAQQKARVVLQAGGRGMLARRRAKRLRQRLQAARRAARKRKAKTTRLEMQQKAAAVKVQSLTRGAQARKKYRAIKKAHVQEIKRRREKRQREVRKEQQKRLKLGAVALVIARLRGLRDRRRYVEKKDVARQQKKRREREQAAKSLAVAQKLARNQAAIRVQAAQRGRRARNELRKRRASQKRKVQAKRASQKRKVQAKRKKEREQAQRSHVALERMERSLAATKLEAVARGRQARNELRRLKAARTRRAQVRRKQEKAKEREQAVRTQAALQRVVRSDAATQVQSLCRATVARQEKQKLVEKKERVMQKRRELATERSRAAKRLWKTKLMATRLAARYRGKVARQEVGVLRDAQRRREAQRDAARRRREAEAARLFRIARLATRLAARYRGKVARDSASALREDKRRRDAQREKLRQKRELEAQRLVRRTQAATRVEALQRGIAARERTRDLFEAERRRQRERDALRRKREAEAALRKMRLLAAKKLHSFFRSCFALQRLRMLRELAERTRALDMEARRRAARARAEARRAEAESASQAANRALEAERVLLEEEAEEARRRAARDAEDARLAELARLADRKRREAAERRERLRREAMLKRRNQTLAATRIANQVRRWLAGVVYDELRAQLHARRTALAAERRAMTAVAAAEARRQAEAARERARKLAAAARRQAQVERMRKRRQAAVEIQRSARGAVERTGRSVAKLRALEPDRRLAAKTADRAREALDEALARDRAAAAAAANNAQRFLEDLERQRREAAARDRAAAAAAADDARRYLDDLERQRREAREKDRAAAAAAADDARQLLDDLERQRREAEERRREAEERRRRRAKLEHDAATRLQVWVLECRSNRYILPYRKHQGGHYRGCPCCVNKPGKYARVFGRYSARTSTPPGVEAPPRRKQLPPKSEPRDFEAVAMEFGYRGPTRANEDRGPPRGYEDRGPPRGYETHQRRPHPSEQDWQFDPRQTSPAVVRDPRRPRLNRSDSYDRTNREYEELQERVENLRRAQHELMVADMRKVPLYDQPARDPGLLRIARAEIDGTLGHVLRDASPPRSYGASSRRPRQQLTRRQLGYE